MKLWSVVVCMVALAFDLSAHPRDAQSTFALLKKGRELSAADAEKLEARLASKPDDEEARLELIAYYPTRPQGIDAAAIKAARLRHLLYLIAHDPQDGFGLFPIGTGVYLLHCQGDDLADPEGYKQAADLWREHLKTNPGNSQIKKNAAGFFQFCSPEEAEALFTALNDSAGLGRLYASAILGVTGRTYLESDPAGSDAALRERPFAQRAQRLLEETSDPGVLVAGTVELFRTGGTLWADGKLDWDYTPLAAKLLPKARAAAPDSINLMTVQTTLPAKGERPPLTIRIGGNVQQGSLIHKVSPIYPAVAKSARIQGTVDLTALIGLDGKILYLHPEGGPGELIPASVQAVRQWVYKPTLLNGRPCYVITRINVNFTIGRP